MYTKNKSKQTMSYLSDRKAKLEYEYKWSLHVHILILKEISEHVVHTHYN